MRKQQREQAFAYVDVFVRANRLEGQPVPVGRLIHLLGTEFGLSQTQAEDVMHEWMDRQEEVAA